MKLLKTTSLSEFLKSNRERWKSNPVLGKSLQFPSHVFDVFRFYETSFIFLLNDIFLHYTCISDIESWILCTALKTCLRATCPGQTFFYFPIPDIVVMCDVSNMCQASVVSVSSHICPIQTWNLS